MTRQMKDLRDHIFCENQVSRGTNHFLLYLEASVSQIEGTVVFYSSDGWNAVDSILPRIPVRAGFGDDFVCGDGLHSS